ncbi:MAG TPA: hypothetical protein VIW94_09825 [Acidimicrobiia bacterium]
MRKTVTFSGFVIEVADKIAKEPAAARAIELLTGHSAASSESARIDQLASIGAARVLAATAMSGYEDLADLLADEPGFIEIQRTVGSHIAGESDDGFETLRLALAELDE